ncbi:MAG TPA: hypothetical protein V6C95_12705 [Coleofasciculaceae cyanobacterium]
MPILQPLPLLAILSPRDVPPRCFKIPPMGVYTPELSVVQFSPHAQFAGFEVGTTMLMFELSKFI